MMLLAMVIGAGLTAGEMVEEYELADTPHARVASGLRLAEHIVDQEWGKDLAIELAVLGLPDPTRLSDATTQVDKHK